MQLKKRKKAYIFSLYMQMYIFLPIICFICFIFVVIFDNLENIFGHHVVRKFYFVTVLPVFLLQILRQIPHNCEKHLYDKTHSHRNSFCLNRFSHAVASEIVMEIDQL